MIRVHHAVSTTDGNGMPIRAFVAVADIQTSSLEEAASLARQFGRRPWTLRHRVLHLRHEPERSTTLGDVLERDACFFVVLPVGFARISGLDAPDPITGGRLEALALPRSVSLQAKSLPSPRRRPIPLVATIRRLLGFA